MRLRTSPLVVLLAALAGSPSLVAAPPASAPATTVARSGAHDFDFNLGVWNTRIRRVVDPLSGSSAVVEMSGTVTVRAVWEGRAQLEEIEVDGPDGHWQGLTLFLYDPVARQWSQSFVNSASGELAAPLVGEFIDGRGELYAQDTSGSGRSILVRGVWSDIRPDSHRFEESHSGDGGKTWVRAFSAELTRAAS